MEVMVFQLAVPGPILPEKDVERTCNIALACVVLAEEHESAATGEVDRHPVFANGTQILDTQ